ncbi:hypothetical protein CAEBREN_01452 [Caenorhabditis brenneri]|uniref:Uncharacterized protein n=1 Tax=Caenorhabditis brenneri TaxID=135651 RepID=G0N7D6_CAEBE|nr:hypothetical protein CAEBREN_01452 [Caenorhabditis brenneri]
MKLVLAITCLVFCARGVSSHGIRAKRGLSADEQKKLLDVLNKDRQENGEKLQHKMAPMTYDLQLEKKADSIDCDSKEGVDVPLQFNSVGQEVYESGEEGSSIAGPLFWPSATKIGCSKTKKCSWTIPEELAQKIHREKLAGKTISSQGLCVTDAKIDDEVKLFNLSRKGLPHPSKYGDLIGVPKVNGASLNSFFYLIPLFLVFYI